MFLNGKNGPEHAAKPWRKGCGRSRQIAADLSRPRSVAASAPPGFVHVMDAVPDAIPEIRYCSAFNFIGDRIDGYERPAPLLTVEAAEALRAVAEDMRKLGFRLKIYDTYRPCRAVNHFMRWTKDWGDTRMKRFFYPDLDKDQIVPRGYIAERSGHSRGSTVDLTLYDTAAGRDADMGGTFDWFGYESHPDWCGDPGTGTYTGIFPGDTPPRLRAINGAQFRNRMILRQAMMRRGFKPVHEEWWHFTLIGEPYPDTYFDFPVR